MKTTATIEQLTYALDQVNCNFGNNIIFKDIKQISKNRVRFTLTVEDSKRKGGRRGHSGRRVKAACWHAHGEFFDVLWTEDPSVVVTAGPLKMQGKQDNWQDRNIGSVMAPLYFSEACDC